MKVACDKNKEKWKSEKSTQASLYRSAVLHVLNLNLIIKYNFIRITIMSDELSLFQYNNIFNLQTNN